MHGVYLTVESFLYKGFVFFILEVVFDDLIEKLIFIQII